MTMHLMHPAFTTIGKSKKKQKFASADAKRKAAELERQWEQKQKEWAKMSKPTAKSAKPYSTYSMPRIPAGRETPKYKSLDTGITGAVSSKPSQHYTGDKVLGVTIVHKSCLQPVFTEEQAKDAASMRR